MDTIKWLYLVNLIFYISTTISRIFVVRDVSIEFEKTRLDCTKQPANNQKKIYIWFWRMLLKTRHSTSSYCYCRFSKQRISRFSPTKGTILYWNKLKSIPSTRVLWKFKPKLVQLFHRRESESRHLRREILTFKTDNKEFKTLLTNFDQKSKLIL